MCNSQWHLPAGSNVTSASVAPGGLSGDPCRSPITRSDTLCLLWGSGCPLDRGAEPTSAGSYAGATLLLPRVMPVSLQVPTSHRGLGWEMLGSACPRAPRRVLAPGGGCEGWAGREEGLQGWGWPH